VPQNSAFTSEFKPELLNGVTVIKAEIPAVIVEDNGQKVYTVNKTMTAIPYYSWANRGKGEMMVWFPSSVKDIDLISNESGTAIYQK
jgi:DUF1680 family protein